MSEFYSSTLCGTPHFHPASVFKQGKEIGCFRVHLVGSGFFANLGEEYEEHDVPTTSLSRRTGAPPSDRDDYIAWMAAMIELGERGPGHFDGSPNVFCRSTGVFGLPWKAFWYLTPSGIIVGGIWDYDKNHDWPTSVQHFKNMSNYFEPSPLH